MEDFDVTPPPTPKPNAAPPPIPVPLAPPAPPVPIVPKAGATAPVIPAVSTPGAGIPPLPKSDDVTRERTASSSSRAMSGMPSRAAMSGRSRSGSPSSRKTGGATKGNRPPLPAGTQVGNYTITAKIGIGGFGIVYSATNTQDGTLVAIKEHMPEGLATREPNGTYVISAPETEERFKATVGEFLEEVTVLMGISHPGIVPILTAFEANGTAYYVMPFQKGTPMTISEQSSLDADQQAQEARHNKRLLLSLLSTMDYLRLHKIVHRDIKPDNILITEEGNTVLLDFGSARQLQPGKVFTNVFTPDFSAPEQSHAETDAEMSESLGPWTDLYSLGVCFYYLITHLFPPRSDLRVISAVDPYTPLAGRADLENLYGAPFLRAIDRALEIKITDRWQNAAAWRIAIGEGMVPIPVKKKNHVKPTTIGGIAAIAVFAGISCWALRERNAALDACEQSMSFNERLLLDLNQEISDIPGALHLQSILGDHLNTYLSNNKRPPGVDKTKYLRTRAATWRSYAIILLAQNRIKEVDAACDQAIAALKQLEKDDPESVFYPYRHAYALLLQTEAAYRRHELKLARTRLTEAMDILQKLCEKAPYNPDFLSTYGQGLREEAQLDLAEGFAAAYQKTANHMLGLYRGLLAEYPDHPKAQEGLGYALQYNAQQAMHQQHYDEAEQQLEEARQIFTNLVGQHPYRLAYKKGLSLTYYTLGSLYSHMSDTMQSKQHAELALDAFRKHNTLINYLEAHDKNKAEYDLMLCRALAHMIEILLNDGQTNLAEAQSKTLVSKAEELMQSNANNNEYALLYTKGLRAIARTHNNSPYYEDILPEDLRRYRHASERLSRHDPKNLEAQSLYADALCESANNALSNNKSEQARTWLQKAENTLKKLVQIEPTNTTYNTQLANTQKLLQSLTPTPETHTESEEPIPAEL